VWLDVSDHAGSIRHEQLRGRRHANCWDLFRKHDGPSRKHNAKSAEHVVPIPSKDAKYFILKFVRKWRGDIVFHHVALEHRLHGRDV
jgi:hypothetical protein